MEELSLRWRIELALTGRTVASSSCVIGVVLLSLFLLHHHEIIEANVHVLRSSTRVEVL
jgi:uncharacterized membrane protein (Fun14 family)